MKNVNKLMLFTRRPSKSYSQQQQDSYILKSKLLTKLSGLGKVSIADLEPALTFCTHLIYGYAGINPETFKLISLNEGLDLDTGKAHYRTVTSLRRRFPNLKIILSVGGNHDENRAAYLSLLETSAGRVAFINSAYTMLKTYQFDGLDLAWEFPPNKPKKIRSGFGSFWHKVKKTFGATPSSIDEKWEEHREEFTALVRELKNALRPEGYQLTLTQLPNVNATCKYIFFYYKQNYKLIFPN